MNADNFLILNRRLSAFIGGVTISGVFSASCIRLRRGITNKTGAGPVSFRVMGAPGPGITRYRRAQLMNPYNQDQFQRPPGNSHDRISPLSHDYRKLSFTQIFGLHPAIAFLTFIVDTMLFGGEGVAGLLGLPTGGATMGIALIVSTLAAGILGIIAYLAQQKWYGDDRQNALIKAMILGFLTAIPTNLPAFVYLSAGVVGLFRRKQ
jgi:hypothetical protein